MSEEGKTPDAEKKPRSRGGKGRKAPAAEPQDDLVAATTAEQPTAEATEDAGLAGRPTETNEIDEPLPAESTAKTVRGEVAFDAEATVALSGEEMEAHIADSSDPLAAVLDAEDDGDATDDGEPSPATRPLPGSNVARDHLKGLLEALIFASDKPQKAGELARAASAPVKEVRPILEELRGDYAKRGIHLDEVAGGFLFRTSAVYAPFVRDMSTQKPVRLSRAQVETLAILAYRQPITRPEIDDIRGVDCGPVLKLLLERDLVRILGKKDEPGRPILYGTTNAFLEFFGLKSLRDLPTLREFTELNEDSRRVVETELGDVLESKLDDVAPEGGIHGATVESEALREELESTAEEEAGDVGKAAPANDESDAPESGERSDDGGADGGDGGDDGDDDDGDDGEDDEQEIDDKV